MAVRFTELASKIRPKDHAADAWLWAHWGATALRQIRAHPPTQPKATVAREGDTFDRMTFWAAD